MPWLLGLVSVVVCVGVVWCVQVKAIARDLQTHHFSRSQESTRKVAAELKTIVSSIEEACSNHDNGTVGHLMWGCGSTS